MHALRQNSINKIREQLDELSGEQLTQLRALESEEDAPRSTLIKAIDEKLEELGAMAQHGSDAAEDASAPAPAVAAAEPAVTPAPWLAPDYCGPLTGDQALERMAHLTKPSAVTAAK